MINHTIPLVELHRHLDGNVRPSTIWELATRYNLPIDASSVKDVESLVYIRDHTSDLLAFLQKLELGMSVLKNVDDCYRIAYENIEDAYKEDLDYVELRFSPYFMALNHQLPLSGVVEAVIDGIQAGTRDFPVGCGLIGILSRTFGSDVCHRELDALLSKKDDICALDLAGDEINYPAQDFISHFKRARECGWNITVHAGEADGPSSIWNAINKLGAQRIGHGVAAIRDEKLMDFLADNTIGIEACPTSNYHTGTILDTANHPLKTFIDKGIQVTLSTDDPGVSAIDIKNEYQVAHELIGLTPAQLEQVQRNGVAQAFLTDAKKAALMNQALRRGQ